MAQQSAARPLPAMSARRSSTSVSSATAASPRSPSLPACSAARRPLRSRSPSSATSTPSGTPATSKMSASSEDTPQGVILDVYVREKPTIREINYKGLNSVTVSDVLERFKKEKVGLIPESQYDPTRVTRAVDRHEGDARRARPPVRHHPDRGQDHSPRLVQLTFQIKEGPTVKVGKIAFTGNHHSARARCARRCVTSAPSAFRTPSSSRTSSPAPSTPASWTRTPSACARPIATAATARRAPASRRPTSATPAA